MIDLPSDKHYVALDAGIETVDGRLVREHNGRINVSVNPHVHNPNPHAEGPKWSEKSYALNLSIVVAACLSLNDAWAQAPLNPATQPGSSFSGLKSFFDPVASVLAYLFLPIVALWQYLVANSSAAIIFSALLAATFAFLSIRNQRAMTRTRETFVTINRDNWDKDLITARKIFGAVKVKLKESGENIAKFSENRVGRSKEDKKYINTKITLETIMNDYENLALAIRHDIVDEEYLFRWMRSAFINDWRNLSPLVTAYRHTHSRPELYIEFEGLAEQWINGRSYKTGRKMKATKRRLRVV